jgi:hypothetical protein
MPRDNFPREVPMSRARQMMSPAQRESIGRQETELQGLQPLRPNGPPLWALCLIGVVMCVANVHLFIVTIGGWFGVVVSGGAGTLEGLAIWSTVKSRYTSSEHREVLRKWSKWLGAFSLAHCVVAIVHFSGYLVNNPVLDFYSHILAFPIIVCLVWFSAREILDKHWVSKLYESVVEGKVTSLINLSQSQAEKENLLLKAEVAQTRHDVYQLKTEMKAALVPILQAQVQSERQIEQALYALPEDAQEKIRKQLEETLGKD